MKTKKFKKGVSKKITENFSSLEFDCKCDECSVTYISIDHVKKLQELRDLVGAIKINSGYRCEAHNKAVGGAKNSQHLLGLASDIVGKAMAKGNVYLYALGLDFRGIGLYKTFIHLDSRKTRKAKWKDL